MTATLLPIGLLDELPEMSWADKLSFLTFKFHQMAQIECPLEQTFVEGDYIRTIAIPKGTLFIGRVHRLGHVVELLSGSVIHVRESCRKVVHAPFSLTTSPGDQVCALTLTDITARTVHPTQGCSDMAALEERFFETTESLRLAGEHVDQRLRRRVYERGSSSDRSRRTDWDGRVSCSRL